MEKPPKSPTICGIAVATMVLSMAAKTMVIIKAVKIQFLFNFAEPECFSRFLILKEFSFWKIKKALLMPVITYKSTKP